MIAALAFTTAFAHTPLFGYHSHHSLPAEPSAALYTRGSSDFYVTYRNGDYMYATVLQPTMLGLQLDAPLNTITVTGPECTPLHNGETRGTRPCTHSHMKNHTPGDRMYEPFGESELTAVKTVITDLCSVGEQRCQYKVRSHTDNPYVFVVGTEEEIGGLWLTGIPIHVDAISSWIGNYTYGYAFLVYVLCALLLLRSVPYNILISTSLAAFAIVFYLTSATSRLMQIAVAGLGWGQLFSLINWLFAIAIAHAAIYRSKRETAAILFLSIAIPVRLFFIEPTLIALFWIALELEI